MLDDFTQRAFAEVPSLPPCALIPEAPALSPARRGGLECTPPVVPTSLPQPEKVPAARNLRQGPISARSAAAKKDTPRGRRRAQNRRSAQVCRSRRLRQLSSLQHDVQRMRRENNDLVKIKVELEDEQQAVQSRVEHLERLLAESTGPETALLMGLPLDPCDMGL